MVSLGIGGDAIFDVVNKQNDLGALLMISGIRTQHFGIVQFVIMMMFCIIVYC